MLIDDVFMSLWMVLILALPDIIIMKINSMH